jgi:hypothetical protein
MNLTFRKASFIFLLLISGYMVNAQPGETTPGDPSGDPDAVPITGIEILLGAGALFGGKRLLDSRRTQK